MFDIGYSELLLIAIVTLLVVGPKELPNLLRTVGKWTGKARSMARHFRSGFDAMVREAEIEEMNKQWATHNQTIMTSTPDLTDLTDLPEPERDADLGTVADLPPPEPQPGPQPEPPSAAPKTGRPRARKAAAPSTPPAP